MFSCRPSRFLRFRAFHSVVPAIAGLAIVPLLCVPAATAPACRSETVAAILTPAQANPRAVRLDCDLTLTADAVVSRPLVLAGSAASGITVDCGGGVIDGGQMAPGAGPDAIVIRSSGRSWREMADNRPRNVTVRNCVVRGSMRIWGLGINGQGAMVRDSSHSIGHTARAQAAAPTRILIDGVRFESRGRIPLYLAPGVTEVTVRNSTFTGTLEATALYLDAESARNTITGNRFEARSLKREMIAVDGSADNAIESNSFARIDHGGIFLYRNCGEGGTVRHQAPTGNRIEGNRFEATTDSMPTAPAIWIGSRMHRGVLFSLFGYCDADSGYPFGSSADNADDADGNVIAGNAFVGLPSDLRIRDDGKGNRIEGNRAD